MDTLASWLRAQMRATGWASLRVCEQHTGVARSTLSNILNGKVQPTVETLTLLERAFKCQPGQLYTLVQRENYGGQ